ncbi:MAG TPA: WD40 repeat domain-containing serine/threonine protein kinase [Pirellulaceae bacterium]|nr:WD40 repeat domain-containing serine/threonine protein kinase [Pirellulaceae bacterium]HMO91204.1 WD40 repeat domain-containing serine/threonine protein kinase [Pirellulaceae bacterium]HMP71385.1 WD40 repeat domain-containing serine/threonine protein kinase [Pirellulaceae bacterium]
MSNQNPDECKVRFEIGLEKLVRQQIPKERIRDFAARELNDRLNSGHIFPLNAIIASLEEKGISIEEYYGELAYPEFISSIKRGDIQNPNEYETKFLKRKVFQVTPRVPWGCYFCDYPDNLWSDYSVLEHVSLSDVKAECSKCRRLCHVFDDSVENADLRPYGLVNPGPLAKGGFAEIYKATDPGLKRVVAVKVLRDDRNRPSIKERFLREMAIHSSLNHPAICPIYNKILFQGVPAFTMRWLQGETLENALERAGQPTIIDSESKSHSIEITSWKDRLSKFLDTFENLCLGIAYAHSKGVVHRDITPRNIYLEDHHTTVQIIDWGLSKRLGQDEETWPHNPHRVVLEKPSNLSTQIGVGLGTLLYMPPEQFSAARDANESADVFALGCILSEIITGSPPYVDLSEYKSCKLGTIDKNKISMRILTTESWPGELALANILNGTTKSDPVLDVVNIAARCLSRDPENRYRHAGEVVDALRKYRSKVNEAVQKELKNKARRPLVLTLFLILFAALILFGLIGQQLYLAKKSSDLNAELATENATKYRQTLSRNLSREGLEFSRQPETSLRGSMLVLKAAIEEGKAGSDLSKPLQKQFWSNLGRHPIFTLNAKKEIPWFQSATICPRRETLAITCWSQESGRVELKLFGTDFRIRFETDITTVVKAMKFNHDGSYLAVAGLDNTLTVFNIIKGDQVPVSFDAGSSIEHIEFLANDRNLLIIGAKVSESVNEGDNRLFFEIIDCESGRTGASQPIDIVGNILAVSEIRPINKLNNVWRFAFSLPDRIEVHRVSLDSRLSQFLFKQERIIEYNTANSLQIDRSGTRLLVANQKSLQAPKVVELESVSTITRLGNSFEGEFQFSKLDPSGRFVINSQGASVKIYEIEKGSKAEPVAMLPHEAIVKVLDFSSDGSQILTVTENGKLRTWEFESGKQISPPVQVARSTSDAYFFSDGSIQTIATTVVSSQANQPTIIALPATSHNENSDSATTLHVIAGEHCHWTPFKFPPLILNLNPPNDGFVHYVGARVQNNSQLVALSHDERGIKLHIWDSKGGFIVSDELRQILDHPTDPNSSDVLPRIVVPQLEINGRGNLVTVALIGYRSIKFSEWSLSDSALLEQADLTFPSEIDFGDYADNVLLNSSGSYVTATIQTWENGIRQSYLLVWNLIDNPGSLAPSQIQWQGEEKIFHGTVQWLTDELILWYSGNQAMVFSPRKPEICDLVSLDQNCEIKFASYDEDSSKLVLGSNYATNGLSKLDIWNIVDKQLVIDRKVPSTISCLSRISQGQTAIGTTEGNVLLLNGQNEIDRALSHEGSIEKAIFDESGNSLLVLSRLIDGRCKMYLWSLLPYQPLLLLTETMNTGEVAEVGFAHDASFVFVVKQDGPIMIRYLSESVTDSLEAIMDVLKAASGIEINSAGELTPLTFDEIGKLWTRVTQNQHIDQLFPVTSQNQLRYYLFAASIKESERRFSEVLWHLNQAEKHLNELKPWPFYLKRAMAHFHLRRTSQALEDIDQAIELSDQAWWIRHTRLLMLATSESISDSEIWRQLKDLQASHYCKLVYWLRTAQYLAASGRWELAIQAAELACEAEPNSKVARLFLEEAFLNFGEELAASVHSLCKLGRYSEAFSILDERKLNELPNAPDLIFQKLVLSTFLDNEIGLKNAVEAEPTITTIQKARLALLRSDVDIDFLQQILDELDAYVHSIEQEAGFLDPSVVFPIRAGLLFRMNRYKDTLAELEKARVALITLVDSIPIDNTRLPIHNGIPVKELFLLSMTCSKLGETERAAAAIKHARNLEHLLNMNTSAISREHEDHLDISLLNQLHSSRGWDSWMYSVEIAVLKREAEQLLQKPPK